LPVAASGTFQAREDRSLRIKTVKFTNPKKINNIMNSKIKYSENVINSQIRLPNEKKFVNEQTFKNELRLFLNYLLKMDDLNAGQKCTDDKAQMDLEHIEAEKIIVSGWLENVIDIKTYFDDHTYDDLDLSNR
jgi:hypothetical protein